MTDPDDGMLRFACPTCGCERFHYDELPQSGAYTLTCVDCGHVGGVPRADAEGGEDGD